jgi:colanic acid biosynthesis glycosyl transferase WcaI
MTDILFVSRYYPPEIAVTGVCLDEVAQRLARQGHNVTVLTTVPNYPHGIVPPEYRGHMLQREEREGVQVIRVWSYVAPNKGFLRRILAQFSFGCLAPLLAWKAVGQPEVVIVTSPPLFNVIAGRVFAWLKRCPLILRVADLWPESAIQLGMLRNPLLIHLAEWLEWSTYQQAAFVWVVTERMRETLMRRGIPLEKLLLITNGVDTAKFRPLAQAQARAALGWDDRFTLLYAGNHGLVYAMSTLLDAAEQLENYPDIHMILVGDGARKAELLSEARKRGLKNVTFFASLPYDDMPLLWAAADVCLIPLRKLSLVEGSLPVKMFEVMACARPFVLGAEGIARDVAERKAEAGIVVEPENVEALVSAILYLRAHPEEAEAFGRRGREYAKFHFDYARLAEVLDKHLEILLEKQAPVTISETPVPISDVAQRSLKD